MQPRGTAAERDRERGHRDAVVDGSAARLGQEAALVCAEGACSFTGPWCVRAREVQLADLSDLVPSGCTPLGQARGASRGRSGQVRCDYVLQSGVGIGGHQSHPGQRAGAQVNGELVTRRPGLAGGDPQPVPSVVNACSRVLDL